MKSIGGRLERWEKSKRGNLGDWVKCKMDRHFFYVGVYRIVNHYHS